MYERPGFPLGTLAVFYVAAARFNAPSRVRTYVSFARYFVGVGCYGVTAIIFYYVVYSLLPETLVSADGQAVLPLLALVAQMALWRIPPTAKIDRIFKEMLYLIIGFPAGGPPPGNDAGVRPVLSFATGASGRALGAAATWLRHRR